MYAFLKSCNFENVTILHNIFAMCFTMWGVMADIDRNRQEVSGTDTLYGNKFDMFSKMVDH